MTASQPNRVEPIYIGIESGLTSPGDTVEAKGSIDLEALELGGRTFSFKDGLAYDIALTNSGEGILATGIVRGVADTECDRCLGPASVPVAAEVSCYYLREEPVDDPDDDQDFGLIDQINGRIDLSDAVMAAVVCDLPFVVLCDEDCLGLCPVCGHNLNEGDCGCGSRVLDEPSKSNPFSVLSGIDFGNKG